MKEVAPGVFVESSYAPYNLAVIRTGKGGILVDIPPNPVHAVTWFQQARGVAGELRYAVMTDARRERQFATAGCSLPIIASEGVLRVMQSYDEERPRREWMEALAAQFPEEVEALDHLRPRTPTLAFSDHFTLYDDERDLIFEAIDGAAPGSLWILLPDAGLLIAGDTVVGSAVPPMAETPDSKAWLNTMTALARRQHIRAIVPGRGEPFIPLGGIEPQREFMRVMRRAARTLARKGGNSLNLSQTAQELGQTFFNHQGRQAIKEIRAGLERLVEEELGEEEPEDRGDRD